jgi:ABC-type uncharacterized transport system permease subunit
VRAARAAEFGVTLAVGITLAILLVRAAGFDPTSTLAAGLGYAFADGPHLAAMIAGALPLLVVAIGVAVAFRAGMFNIGAEGQLYFGAMTAAIAGAQLGPMSNALHLALCLMGSAVAGGLLAAGLGWLRAYWGVDEVLSTLLSNYIAVLFCTYLANGPLRDPGRQSGSTVAVHDSARFATLVPATQLTTALVFVVVLTGVVAWVMSRSTLGYRWRMTGIGPLFADATGMNVARLRVGAMAVSGALCGVGGGLLVTASQGRFWSEIGGGIGWDAVLIALIAQSSIVGVVAWTLVYASLRSVARGMEQAAGIASELSDVLIAMIVILVAVRTGAFSALATRGRRLVDRVQGKVPA